MRAAGWSVVRSATLALASWFVLCLAASEVRAQAELRPEAPAARGLVYREAGEWVRATRRPARGAADAAATGRGLSPVTLEIAGAPLRGYVGRAALVQLTPAAWSDAPRWLRAHGLSVLWPASAPSHRARSSEPGEPLAAALSPGLRLLRVEGRPGEDGLSVAVRLARVSGVESAAPDLVLRRKRAAAEFEIPPNDPRYRGQWYLAELGIERAWELSAGDPDTGIVIVDDGCDMTHPDLVDALAGGRDVIDEDDDPSYTPNEPGNEHGTACAGIAAATGNNGEGIAGVCPRCSLYCVRLFESSHSLVPISADIAAFEYAQEIDAAVVSNSWGFAEPGPAPPLLRGVIQRTMGEGRAGRGTVVVFAAGNDNREIGGSELAAINGVINVGAINVFDEAAPFSNFGASLALTAPTGSLTTDVQGPDGADPSDYTSLFGGTSAACPVVAGVAGLMLSAAPELTGAELRAILIATARPAPFATPDDQGHDPLYGYGIVDPAAALRSALGLPEPAAPSDAGVAVDGGGDAGAAAERDAGRRGGDAESSGESDADGCAVGAASGGGSGWSLACCIGLALVAVRRGRPARVRTCSRSRR